MPLELWPFLLSPAAVNSSHTHNTAPFPYNFGKLIFSEFRELSPHFLSL